MHLRQGTRNETKSNHVDQPISRFARSGLPPQSPLLAEFFLDIAFKIVSSRLKTPLQKKCPQTEKIWPDLEVAGTRFWTSKTALLVQVASKRGSPIKEHLRLLRSLALSSNCAFGAKNVPPPFFLHVGRLLKLVSGFEASVYLRERCLP